MSQNQSTLLRIPLELRNEVYSYLLPRQLHAYLRDNEIRLSTCFEPDKDARSSAYPHKYPFRKYGECEDKPSDDYDRHPYDGSERRSWEGPNQKLEYVRRLQSSWGPHWMCEEGAREGIGETMALLLACKQIYAEAIDLVWRVTVINCTDLKTLEWLSGVIKVAKSSLNETTLCVSSQRITRLNITLRWPLEVFQGLEISLDQLDFDDLEDQDLKLTHSWMCINDTISHFENLTSLNLWFDHADHCSWSVVNERTLLSSLLAHLSTTRIRTVIILPKLHPLHERHDRHFMTPDLSQHVRLHRKLRQRYHSDETGRDEVLRWDFPVAIDLMTHLSLEEIEDWERKKWKEGVDVDALVEDIFS